jgi:hypothetical protein
MMNILITQNYVAGIFEHWSDTQDYIARKPTDIVSFSHINCDLVYPFYLLEIGNGCFAGYQTEDDAQELGMGIILYTITRDYQPDHVWMDQMGILPHNHL